MQVVIVCIIIAVFFTVLDSKRIIDWGMKAGFILTGILLAIHYDYGNDYMHYLERFRVIWQNDYSISNVFNNLTIRNNEYGWTLINLFFSMFGENGFYLMVATLTTFQTWVYYRTIHKYVSRKWWWFATFIYLTHTSLFILEFSMMRQSFAIAVFLLLFGWIKKRKILQTLIVIYILITIHASAMVLLPFAFLGYLPKKGGSFYAWIIITAFIVCFISKTLLSSILQSLSTIEQIGEYTYNYSGGKNTERFGLGFLIHLIPFALAIRYLFTHRDIPSKHLIPILITSMGYILVPFMQILQLIVRIGFYFTAYSIVAEPIIYNDVKNKLIRNCLILLECSILAYTFLQFFSSPVWIDYYTHFDTIFSVL